MAKHDRRIQQTHERLQKALIELINERNYDSITVQEIVDQANVGRTTFYEHYKDKDDLFMTCHETVVSGFHQFHSQPESLLMPNAPSEMISIYQNLIDNSEMLRPIFQSQDGVLILRRIRDASAQEIFTQLHNTFPETDSSIPLDMLANYLAGAQIALMQWWLDKHKPYSAEELAQTFHRLQRAAISDAFGLSHKD